MLRFPLLLAGLLAVAGPLAGQVGNEPTDSPFHDIRMGTAWEAWLGTIQGSGGPIPVGPRDGPYAGVRILLRAKNTLSLGLGVWATRTERTELDPNAAPAAQEIGTRDANLLAGELMIRFNLTGGKRWHRLAPYVGIGVGLVNNTSGDKFDPGGYEFGSKFFFAPAIGTRIFANDNLYLRVEARGLTWKLKYPVTYGIEPTDDPGTAEEPNAINPLGLDGQYVLTPAFSFGIGISF